MLSFDAGEFVNLVFLIRMMSERGVAWFTKDAHPQARVSELAKQPIALMLEGLEKHCGIMALSPSGVPAQIARIRESLEFGCDYEHFRNMIRDLENRLDDELEATTFWVVPPETAKYLPSGDPLFGKDIENAFPEMSADIEDAGWCLGFGRGTATVYHLMRVMECALVKLAGKLNIPPQDLENKTWGEILGKIDGAVNALPKRTQEHEDFSEAAVHLRHVKNAWRDPTMHNRRRYDKDEATTIFEYVKTFVVSLLQVV